MQQFMRVGTMLRKRVYRIGFLSAALLAAVCGLKTASGQEYETKPLGPIVKKWERKDFSTNRLKVMKMLRGTEELNAELLGQYFEGYYFPQMTQTDRLAELANDRQAFSTQFAQARLSPGGSASVADAAHAQLVKSALDFMRQLTDPTRKFHPAVRYNAMLLIGDLNKVEPLPTGISEKHGAEPLPEALGPMYLAIKDENQIDAVRVAALLGILRHAERDGEKPSQDRMDSNRRRAIKILMLEIVSGTQPPGTRSKAGQLWMARRAVEVLGALGRPANAGELEALVKDLEALVADAKRPMLLRCDAAVALGRLKGAGFNPEIYGKKFAQIASQAGHEELNRMLAHQKMVAAKVEQREKDAGLGGAGGFSEDGGLGGSFLPDGGGLPPPSSGLGEGGLDGSGLDGSGLGDSGLDGSGLGDSGLDGSGLGDSGLDDFGGLGDPYGGGMPSVDIALRENYKVDLSRRRLTYYASCALQGFGRDTTPKTGPSGTEDKEKEKNKEKTVKDWIEEVKDAALVKAKEEKDAPAPTPEDDLQAYIDALRNALTELDKTAGIKVVEPPPDADPAGLSAPTAPSEPPGGPADLPPVAVPPGPAIPAPGPLGK